MRRLHEFNSIVRARKLDKIVFDQTELVPVLHVFARYGRERYFCLFAQNAKSYVRV
jgi:hypothetical protein